jgi:hypothetical protein
VISGDRLGHLDQVVGAPSEGIGLHGTYTFMPAHDSECPLEAPLLYYVNLGWPLWDAGSQVETDAAEVRPRDDGTRIAITAEEME